jgi:WD40 repeat protein
MSIQILLNPAKATRSNLAGIAHVVSRMDWYCGLTEYLLNKDNIVIGSESFQTILQQLEKTVVALYKALLLYQMKSVCSYYRNQGLVFLRSLANLDDWDGDLKSVTDAEVTLEKDSGQYNSEHAKSSLGRLVELAEKMETLFKDVRQTLRDFIVLQKEMQMDEEDTKCLRDLFVVDPQDDMDTIEMKKDKLLDEAYKWILNTKEYTAFTNWSNDESPLTPCRLLWVKGHAGTGKTMLLIGIIRQLSDQLAVLSPNVSHFFCQGTDDKAHNSATAILRSLVWMLLVQQPHLISHLRLKYKHKGRSLFSDGNALVAMSRIFESMLTDPGLLPVYFIVDALDECDQGLAALVQLISTSLTLSNKVKWLVSSRPDVDVHAKLKNPDTLRALVELDAQSLEGPVNAYINHKLRSLEDDVGYDKDALAKISKVIHRRAENTFLWVALVFKELEPEERVDPVKIIEEIPPGLSDLYGHMMTRIENGKDQQYYKNVLVATALAYRPLSLSELAILAGLPREITEIKTQMIVEKCRSFLAIRKKTVYLIHQSVKDYLEANYTSRLQQGGAVQGHADISRRSINAMSKLTKNIYALPHLGSELEDITVPSPDPLEGLRYSCAFWVQHVCQLYSQFDLCQSVEKLQENAFDLHDNGQVHRFLKEHFHHWLEALSLMRDISLCVVMIIQLENLIVSEVCHCAIFVDANEVGQPKPSELYALVYDAKRFILKFRSVIELAPLQIYNSALLFSPQASIVRNLFQKEIDWVRISSGVEQNWSPILQTLEGHSGQVMSVAFSPNGGKLASGSRVGTIQVWDVTTGRVEQTLEGHSDSAESVAFSPDGGKLASGSRDGTIRVWDVATGQVEQILEGHSERVNSIAFSPDGGKLASGSNDGTIRLWDVATGRVEQTLEGYSDSVESYSDSVKSVAFSPDGGKLASGSDDGTIQVWDVTTGRVEQMLKGHSDSVESVAFSLDGGKLASGSNYGTIRVWDITIGRVEQTLEGYSSWINSIAFSPDRGKLASGSRNGTIQVWDIATGRVEQTLGGYSERVNSIAFLPDGGKLASGSDNGTIRVWDVATGQVEHTLEGHWATINIFSNVEFSPNGGKPSLCQLETIRHRDESRLLYLVDESGYWVTRNGLRILNLPVDHRPGCVATNGSNLAIGSSAGLVTIITFYSDAKI